MADQIDHTARALYILDILDGPQGDGSHTASEAIAAAQVHATLALAEQARIANLIALNAPYQEMDGAMYSIGERLAGSDQWNEVVAALKIGDPE